MPGCASRLPGSPLAGGEAAAAREAFRRLAGGQAACDRALDAEVSVSLSSPWRSGSLDGYLQLMAPGYLKFIAVSPLGQPLLLLGTDGSTVNYVVPAERRVYQGRADGETLARFLPSGLDPARSYYWLIGRLRPGQVRILEVAGEAGGTGTWVKFRHDDERRAELVLFDPAGGRLLRHRQLDEQGGVVFEAEYGEFTDGECAAPGLVTLHGGRLYGTLTLRLDNRLPADSLRGEDFKIDAPPDFTRIPIP